MSIINQTLRDLDARLTAPAAVAAPPVATVRRRPVLWALAILLLPLAGVAGWFAWSVLRTPTPERPRVVRSVQPAPAPSTPLPAPAPAIAPVAAVSAPPVASAPLAAPAPVVEPTPLAATLVTPRNAAPPTRPTPAPSVEPAPVAALPAARAPLSPPPAIQRQTRQPAPAEIGEERYRKALAQLQAGHQADARAFLAEALQAAPAHIEARQTLAALLSRTGHAADAEALLREGRAAVPDHSGFALSLARLQAARGNTAGAAATLLEALGSRGVDPEYRATLAALLVQLDRHSEATTHYELALRQQPGQGTWWAGLGMSLEAQGKTADARAAYQRALQAGNLPENLATFARAKAGN